MPDTPQGTLDVSGAHFCGQSCDSQNPYVVIKRSKYIVLWRPTCQEWGHQTQFGVQWGNHLCFFGVILFVLRDKIWGQDKQKDMLKKMPYALGRYGF